MFHVEQEPRVFVSASPERAAASDEDDEMTEPILPYATPSSRSFSREIFGIVVRTTGLIFALYGVRDLLPALAAIISSGSFRDVPYAAYGCVEVAIGILVLKGEWVVQFAYGSRP